MLLNIFKFSSLFSTSSYLEQNNDTFRSFNASCTGFNKYICNELHFSSEMDALKAISLPLGFGFHPTDVELISYYLKRKNLGLKVDDEVIPELDIYKHEPWDLPGDFCSYCCAL